MQSPVATPMVAGCIPNYGHVTIAGAGYPLRRAWDFMVQNLIGATPPPPHDFTPPAQGARC